MSEKILLQKEKDTQESSNLILQDTTYHAEQQYSHPLKRNNKMRKKTKSIKAKKKNNKKMKLKKVTVAAAAADSNAMEEEEKDETPMVLDHFVDYYSLLLNSEEVPAPDGNGGTREECVVEGSLGMVLLRYCIIKNQVSFSFQNLVTPNEITAFHIHEGKRGIYGPTLINIPLVGSKEEVYLASTSIPSSTYTWIEDFQFDEKQKEMLMKGDMYINIHTDKCPDGEIRGQIIQLPQQ